MQARLRTSSSSLPDDGFSFRFLCFVLLASVLLMFSRRPGDLIHAQFYAEDGKVWFAQAYNFHWLHSLLVPDEGYLHLLARLCAGPALLLPLRWAPLWFNLAGATIQALPVVLLLSPRCSTWGSLRVRIVLALLYLATPNTGEIHVTLTNAQWHYALFQFLLAFGRPPKNRLEVAGDIAVFTVGGFTGPFDLILLPILLLFWVFRRQRWTLVIACCLLLGTVFQLQTMRTGTAFGLGRPGAVDPTHATYLKTPRGANVRLFVRIAGGNLFLDSMVGAVTRPFRLPTVLLLFFLIFGVFIVACGCLWGPTPLRYFSLYAFLLFAAALKRPLAWDDVSMWHSLASGNAMRYCFLPMIAFLWSAAYALERSQSRLVRLSCVVVFALFLLGLRRWRYLPYVERHFDGYAQQFEAARPGSTLNIPLEPGPWFMTLIRH